MTSVERMEIVMYTHQSLTPDATTNHIPLEAILPALALLNDYDLEQVWSASLQVAMDRDFAGDALRT